MKKIASGTYGVDMKIINFPGVLRQKLILPRD